MKINAHNIWQKEIKNRLSYGIKLVFQGYYSIFQHYTFL